MKKVIMALVAVLAIGFAGLTLADQKPMALSAGDEVFVCNCGEMCPCQMMSKKAGNCTCDKKMVKARVIKVEEGTALVAIDGKERSFKTAGKYACACGEMCNCGTISQKAGKCTCGKPMKEVE